MFPNPFQDQFSFILNDYYPKNAELIIFDGLGRQVHRQQIFHGWNAVNGHNWSNGLYLYELHDNGLILDSGKVIKTSQ